MSATQEKALDYSFIARIEAGSWVKPDGWQLASNLVDCDDWDAAPYRLHASRVGLDLAVRVEITGRKRRYGSEIGFSPGSYVRVRIVFVGDGEPDTDTRGWMRV